MQSSSMLLSALSPGRRPRMHKNLSIFLTMLACWKALPVPANPVTLCSPDQWVMRCSLFLLLWAENSCKMIVFISKCWMLFGSVHVPTSQAPFFLWHFVVVYSTASLPNSSLCCDLLLPISFSCWSVCQEQLQLGFLLTFSFCLEYFCSLAHPDSIFPKSKSISSRSPSLQVWNFDVDLYLISFNAAWQSTTRVTHLTHQFKISQ